MVSEVVALAEKKQKTKQRQKVESEKYRLNKWY